MKIPSLLALALIAFAATAQAQPADEVAALAAAQKLVDGLKYQEGQITVGDGLATLHLPAEFRYLNGDDAQTVLTKLWGNPPSAQKPLGMLVQAGVSLLHPASWAVVISFDDDGYVKDHDAAKIDYNKLLKEMQEGTRKAGEERRKQGYPAIELVGWAAPPRYDPAAHKLYWAKELKFADSPEHTLNYNIRALGRRGVLVLNAVAGMAQLKEIEAATPQILAMVEFNQGHRYADFDGKSDKVAGYGLAALVAGGIAAKTGLLKGLWLAILAGKKFIIIAVIGIGAFLKKIITGRQAPAAVEPDQP